MHREPECADCLSAGVTTWRPIKSGVIVKRCATHTRERNKAVKHRKRTRTQKSTYGLTEADSLELMEEQGGLCGICGPITGNRGASRALSTDHDHACCAGKTSCGRCVRGYLCSTCNTYLGRIRDSMEVAARMVMYLQDPPWQRVLRRRDGSHSG